MKKYTKSDYDAPKTIEELLKSRRRTSYATMALIKDVARRIKKLERKNENKR